jgi:hypothetical protein
MNGWIHDERGGETIEGFIMGQHDPMKQLHHCAWRVIQVHPVQQITIHSVMKQHTQQWIE